MSTDSHAQNKFVKPALFMIYLGVVIALISALLAIYLTFQVIFGGGSFTLPIDPGTIIGILWAVPTIQVVSYSIGVRPPTESDPPSPSSTEGGTTTTTGG